MHHTWKNIHEDHLTCPLVGACTNACPHWALHVLKLYVAPHMCAKVDGNKTRKLSKVRSSITLGELRGENQDYIMLAFSYSHLHQFKTRLQLANGKNI